VFLHRMLLLFPSSDALETHKAWCSAENPQNVSNSQLLSKSQLVDFINHIALIVFPFSLFTYGLSECFIVLC